MTIPSGYTALSLVGFTDQGTYDASKTYVANDLVHYKNSIFRALKDDLTGTEPVEGENWAYFVFTPDDVEENTELARNAAQSAQNSATAASLSQKSATDSAAIAKTSASQASDSQSRASSYAATAQAAATTAAGYAGAAAYSIGINPDTGHMAIFYNKEDS